ncbi:hypothetical protein [Hyphobacterium sp.]|uniref:hypothetical protein n=1 Tax=Hyphobacterium sp. TaxID=2004662 RepID=UPI003BAAFEF1
MEFLDTARGWLDQAYAFFEPGLLMYAGNGESVNWMPLAIQVGIIALVLALLLRSAGAILIFTIVGVVIHIIVDIVMPMVRGGGMDGFDFGAFANQFTDVTYLKYLGALAIAYFIGILILGMIKGMLFRGD